MSTKFLSPPSPATRSFACAHRLTGTVAPRPYAVLDAPLTAAQSAALAETQDRAAQAYCGAHAMLAPTPLTAPPPVRSARAAKAALASVAAGRQGWVCP